eukprot:TRINITY_DN11906_c0_g2_i1.p1 TRINITY_DN11906_c0_g2~~TRINITY_DN11906_c0_g2_i1.p1  ORF type:complete len:189 (+),score=4.87 TRINITY_DN11906_c0_g2_i1:115-681(+)
MDCTEANRSLLAKYQSEISFEEVADWLKANTSVQDWGVKSIEGQAYLKSHLRTVCQYGRARLKKWLCDHDSTQLPARLHIAVWLSESECASAILLSELNDADCKFPVLNVAQHKYCQLLTACRRGDIEAVHACMEDEAELVWYDDKGYIVHSALHWCVRICKSAFLRLFLGLTMPRLLSMLLLARILV